MSSLAFSFQEECTVEINTLPYSDCENAYWQNVTFLFYGKFNEKFESPILNVCDVKNKKMKVTVVDTSSLRMGNIGLIQPDLGPQFLKPDSREWHLESITAHCKSFSSEVRFGIGRKIESGRLYNYWYYDTSLPDMFTVNDQRVHEKAVKRVEYTQTKAVGSGPYVLKNLPREDLHEYHLQIAGVSPTLYIMKKGYGMIFGANPNISMEFTSIEEMKTFWDKVTSIYPNKPIVNAWDEDDFFVAQRLQGCLSYIIRRIQKIPSSFRLDLKRAKKIIGKNIHKTVLYITDLEFLDGIPSMWAPMALFYLDTKENKLKPLAIQLLRNATPEQVFYSDDEINAWNLAKIYYNGAEFVVHGVYEHFIQVHLLLDNVAVTAYNYLSPSHPILKLLKPHFYMMTGNTMSGLGKLFHDGGYLDRFVTGGAKAGRAMLLSKAVDTADYNSMNPLTDNLIRKTEAIPIYPYRDRGTDIYRAIKSYVKDIVTNYYGPGLIMDSEIMTWRIMLARSSLENGAGISHLPGDDHSGMILRRGLINLVSTLIYHATVKHAAISNGQFPQMSFPPNYPARLNKPPPSRKVGITEKDILSCLPNKQKMYIAGSIALTLSYSINNELGHFDRQFLHSPSDQLAIDRFKERLNVLRTKKYKSLKYPYTDLDIDQIKNSVNV
ncbi:Uncharacterised protein g3356 [Pycnogonum litorale]